MWKLPAGADGAGALGAAPPAGAVEVPGATARQLSGFGTASGAIGAEYFSLGAGTDIAPLLQGLEGDRPLVAREDRRRLRRAAEKHDLWLTAGSDWHGWGDDADLGLYRVEAARIRRFVDAFGGAVALTLPVE